MGLNVKRKFFGIENFENYIRIYNLNFTITHNFNQNKEIYWEIEFKISLNSDSRDIEKISSQIINKEIIINTKTDNEQKTLDNMLTGYIDQNKGYGELGGIIVTIPLGQFVEKNIHPLFFQKTKEEIFNYFYDSFKNEYKGHLGIKTDADISLNQEDNNDFKNRMISKITDTIKQRS